MNVCRIAAVALMAAVIGAGWAVAQDEEPAPLFGTIKLSAGFMPDPVSVDVAAGGGADAHDRTGCEGQIGIVPTLRLSYEAGGFPLVISLQADGAATLVVSDPGGAWTCGTRGDDNGLGPAVTLFEPQSGQYDIWVGSVDGTPGEATVSISEVTAGVVVVSPKITWLETAVHLRTDARSHFDFVCPPTDDPTPYPVWGTDIYTDNSSICAAAVHAGVITLTGGAVRILRLDGLDGRNAYIASTRNGVTTRSEDDWFWSFRFAHMSELAD